MIYPSEYVMIFRDRLRAFPTSLFGLFGKCRDRAYDAIIREDIPHGLRSHVFMFRVLGIWRYENDSLTFKWLTSSAFILFGVVFPLSILANIIFVQSIEAIMEYSFMALNCAVIAFKGILIHCKSDQIREIFRTHNQLMRAANDRHEIYMKISRENSVIQVLLTSMFNFCWLLFLIENVIADDEERFWPSTLHWPFEFADKHVVYMCVLVFQGISDWYVVFLAGTEDSFLIALVNNLCGHVITLKEKLRSLGTHCESDVEFYADLVRYSLFYEECFR